jgi:hypothetical protein
MDTKTCLKCKKKLIINMYAKEMDKGIERIRNVCNVCRLSQIQQRQANKKALPKTIPESKECRECKLTKESNLFNKCSTAPDGLTHFCKGCYKVFRKRKREARLPTNEIVTTLHCSYCLTNRPSSDFRRCPRAKTGYFSKCNLCWKPREWNKEKQKAAEAKYVAANPDKIKAKWKRAAEKPARIIRDRLNHRIADAMRSMNTRKDNKTSEYTGCSMPYLKKWLEYHFTDEIGWHNYGEWHIDHVMPCSSFDLTKPEDQAKCFNWQNLRPCLASENMAKGDKIFEHLISEQKEKVSNFLKVNPLPTQPGDRVGGAE